MGEFQTSDIQLAALLHALGCPLTRIEGPPARRVFVLRDVADEMVTAYYREGLPVSPQQLFRSYRHLKRQVFEPD